MGKTGEGREIIYLFVIVVIFLAFVLLVYFCKQVDEFYKELYFYNIEIGRTHGREKAYWLRKRRRLWFSLIPFANFIMDLKNKKNESNPKLKNESEYKLKSESQKRPDKPSNKQINSPEKKSEPKPKKRVFAKFINKVIEKTKNISNKCFACADIVIRKVKRIPFKEMIEKIKKVFKDIFAKF